MQTTSQANRHSPRFRYWLLLLAVAIAAALLFCLLALPRLLAPRIQVPLRPAPLDGYAFNNLCAASDGSLYFWGETTPGVPALIRYSDWIDRRSPLKVAEDIVAVSISQWAFYGIDSGGTLWLWSATSSGTLFGDVTEESPIQVMDSVAQVSCASDFCLAVQKDGTLWGWGNAGSGAILPPDGLDPMDVLPPRVLMRGVRFAFAAPLSSYAVTADGTLWAAGGRMLLPDSEEPVVVREFTPVMENVAAVSDDEMNILILQEDGTLLRALYREDLLAVDFREPERLLDDVVYCNRGTAIRRDGTLYAWGQNDYGQLGTEPDEDYHETPQRMAEHVRCAVMNQRSLTYLTEDDQVYTVGWNFVSSIDGVTDWGEPCDEHGQAPCYLPHQMIFENTAED